MQTVSLQNSAFDVHQPRFVAMPLAELGRESTEWLWPERIPAGVVTLFCGDPEMGKSFVSLDIAARISTGAAWPALGEQVREGRVESNTEGMMGRGEEGEDSAICNLHSAIPDHPRAPLGSVLILSAEDNARQTIYPRLERMGGDLKKVRVLRPVRSGSAELPFSLARDLQELEYAALTMGDCKMIVIDPITSYLDGAAWTNAAMIRTVLDPLKGVAERTGAAIILINHLTKAKTAAIYRSLGSISIVGMCRVAWIFSRDPSDQKKILMMPLKNNLAARASTFAFKIDTGKVEWALEGLELSCEDFLDFGNRQYRENAISRAKDWVQVYFREHRDPSRRILEHEALKNGISSMTLRRACKELGVKFQLNRVGESWSCHLPVRS